MRDVFTANTDVITITVHTRQVRVCAATAYCVVWWVAPCRVATAADAGQRNNMCAGTPPPPTRPMDSDDYNYCYVRACFFAPGTYVLRIYNLKNDEVHSILYV